MLKSEPQEIFLNGTHGVGIQDKKPPGRFERASSQPLTATTSTQTAIEQLSAPDNAADDRPKHHGSETRQTVGIAARVPLFIKTEINRLIKLKGGNESSTVKDLLEQALAKSQGEQFAVMIRNTIQEAVKTELRKDREWVRKITYSNYLAAEQARLHAVDLHRLFIPSGQDINQKIRENRELAKKHLKFYFHLIDVEVEQQSWPSLK
jgi:hypothetical protein